jgi:hypothetical protein
VASAFPAGDGMTIARRVDLAPPTIVSATPAPLPAEAPFKHIQAAVDRVRPGDVITVCEGTYREMIVWTTPGEAGKPITLQAATGATVVTTPCHNCIDQLMELNRHYKLGVEVKTLGEVVADALVLPA